jgi:hypothetical protein
MFAAELAGLLILQRGQAPAVPERYALQTAVMVATVGKGAP